MQRCAICWRVWVFAVSYSAKFIHKRGWAPPQTHLKRVFSHQERTSAGKQGFKHSRNPKHGSPYMMYMCHVENRCTFQVTRPNANRQIQSGSSIFNTPENCWRNTIWMIPQILTSPIPIIPVTSDEGRYSTSSKLFININPPSFVLEYFRINWDAFDSIYFIHPTNGPVDCRGPARAKSSSTMERCVKGACVRLIASWMMYADMQTSGDDWNGLVASTLSKARGVIGNLRKSQNQHISQVYPKCDWSYMKPA